MDYLTIMNTVDISGADHVNVICTVAAFSISFQTSWYIYNFYQQFVKLRAEYHQEPLNTQCEDWVKSLRF